MKDDEDDIDSVLFNPVASTIPKWRTFKLLSCVLLLNRPVDLHEILYRDNTEGDLDSILLTPVASSISKWGTFKFLW
jgi:hypothetical protein